jgi:hypothetical protein
MTADLPPRFTRLTFHGPLSEPRAARLVGRLPDHPLAAETRKKADDHLSVWLRASRGCLGLAYLTLIPVP